MATDLGQLVYTLTLNDEGFATQMDGAKASMDGMAEQATVAGDEMSASMKKAGASADGMAVQTREAGAASEESGAMADIGSKGFGALKDSMMSAMPELLALFAGYEGLKAIWEGGKEDLDQQQLAQSQLTTAIKNSHDAVGMSLSQLQDLAEAKSKDTDYTKAQTMTMEESLVTVNGMNKDSMPTAIGLTQDLAAKMAAMRGQAVPSMQMTSMASRSLAKALQDPTTGISAFTRAGVTFTKSQQDQIKAMAKAGDTAGAQKLLMQDLSSYVSGAASASANTYQGRVEMMKKAMDETSASAIQLAEKGLSDLAHWFMSILPTIEAIIDKVWNYLKPAIMDVFHAIADNLIPTIEKHKAGLMDLLKVIGDVIGVVMGIVLTGFKLFIDIVAVAIGIIAGIINIISTLIHWFSQMVSGISSAISAVIGWFSRLGGMITSTVGGFGRLLLGAGEQLVDGLVSGIENAAGKVFDAVKGIGNKAVSALKGVLKIFSPSRVFADIGANVTLGLAQGITDNADSAVNATTQVGQQVIQAGNNMPTTGFANQFNNSSSQTGVTYQFGQGSVVLNSADAVNAFFNMQNRNSQLEQGGIAPIAGTTGV